MGGWGGDPSLREAGDWETSRAAAAVVTGGWRAVAVAVLAVAKRLERTEAVRAELTVIPEGGYNKRRPGRPSSLLFLDSKTCLVGEPQASPSTGHQAPAGTQVLRYSESSLLSLPSIGTCE